MNSKFFKLLSLVFIIISCHKAQKKETVHNDIEKERREITEKDISKIKYTEFALDEKTEAVIADWTEYHELNDIITNVKKGDLSFLEDNKKMIEELLKNFKKNQPTLVKTPSILARILALETKIYKLESVSNLNIINKTELTETIKEFLIAFSNFNLQMNKKIEFDNQNIEKP